MGGVGVWTPGARTRHGSKVREEETAFIGQERGSRQASPTFNWPRPSSLHLPPPRPSRPCPLLSRLQIMVSFSSFYCTVSLFSSINLISSEVVRLYQCFWFLLARDLWLIPSQLFSGRILFIAQSCWQINTTVRDWILPIRRVSILLWRIIYHNLLWSSTLGLWRVILLLCANGMHTPLGIFMNLIGSYILSIYLQ